MKKFGNKGITLVALVVTIIVLIILAGVSISLVLGQDGVVQKAKEGRDSYAEAARIENEQLANVDAFAMDIEDMVPVSETITGTITNMTDGEIEISATINLEGNIDFTKTKYVFTTSNNALGTNDESLYKDGIIEQASSSVSATKAAGTYYLHVLTTSTNGAKKEIISEEAATSGGKKDFDYTGNVQNITLTTGNYKLEVWGAEGGKGGSAYGNKLGGYGGYSSGKLRLNENSNIYVVVGGKGTDNNTSGSTGVKNNGGYNGGGNGDGYGAGGGGATHIATTTGVLKDLSSNKSDVIIVAGAGGGASCDADGRPASGGGYIGNGTNGANTSQAGRRATGGTQETGGLRGTEGKAENGGFGYGGGTSTYDDWTGGGGAGWYGGGSVYCVTGGGGSGYINTSKLTEAYMYGYNVLTSNETATKTYSTTNVSSTPPATYAKQGNGYARITALD